MKKTSRKRRRGPKARPDQIHDYVEGIQDQHQSEWQRVLHSSAPNWEYLLCLHLRLVELEHLEAAAAELL